MQCIVIYSEMYDMFRHQVILGLKLEIFIINQY